VTGGLLSHMCVRLLRWVDVDVGVGCGCGLEHVTCVWLLHMDFVPVEGPDTEVYVQTRQQATHRGHTHRQTHAPT
jgi:hypothetical protein